MFYFDILDGKNSYGLASPAQQTYIKSENKKLSKNRR